MGTSTGLRAGLWLALLLSLLSCGWTPEARDVQPRQLLAGPVRVQRLLDQEGRHALFTAGVGAALHYRILDSDTRMSCELIAGDVPVSDPLLAPNLRGKGVAAFWMPVLRADLTLVLEPDQDPPPQPLYFTNEKCALIGPFGLATRGPDALEVREDKRGVSIVPGPDGALTLVDPWLQQTRLLAAHEQGHDQVALPDGSSLPQALWLIEDGKLTQRGLDGTLLLSLGSAVSQFQQVLLQGAQRIAYTDGSSVFEAKGPAFSPVLISDDACDPLYSGSALDLHTPCGEQQLVRIDLLTGAIKRFTKGVYKAYVQGDASFELVAGETGGEVWIAVGTARTQLLPPPYNAISVLDKSRIAGRTRDGKFAIWNLATGFQQAFDGVDSIQAFRDSRTNRLLWLMLYQVKDRLGRLVGFDQSELERVVAGTQPTPPQVLAEQVLQGAYRVYLPNILPEPMVLTLEPPIGQHADQSFFGQLNARLLSGSLASRIDDGVSSSEVVLAPYPGILYGILEGPRSGLWFAAL